MSFKSYSWVIGTTSFRTSQLNYKIEKQLQLLNDFWANDFNGDWNNDTQKKYYMVMKKENFVKGDANIPDKDAREKTSGLVELGLLKPNRRLTEVGQKIRNIPKIEICKNNIFYIPEDSYYYLLQFLKLQINKDDIKLKPFIALLYMLDKLEYLTYDEFTYLLPLCKNKNDVIEMVNFIKTNRIGFNLDDIIATKFFGMENYIEAWEFFLSEQEISENTFENIGMNRKSKSYDRPYNNIYHTLVDLVFHLKKDPFSCRVDKYNQLFDYCSKISGNAKILWKNYLFFGYKKNGFDEEFDEKFKKLEISEKFNIIDFKKEFFEKIHIFKWKINLKEYFDLNKRYFSLTDIIRFTDEKVELDLLPKYFFSPIVDDLLNEELLGDEKYDKLFNSLISIENVSNKYDTDINVLISSINTKLGINLNLSNIDKYIDNKKLKDFNSLIDEKFTFKDLLELLDDIKARNDEKIANYITDNATIPTIFEYILGIIWYRISDKKGDILQFMNLSLDADLLPRTHAGGGMADIVYCYNENKYPKHNLLLEATLLKSTGQRSNEMEPVSRHLGEYIKTSKNDKDYVIFVANILDERVILDFRNRKTYKYPLGNNKYSDGLKIIPLNIDMIKIIINKGLKYKDIYEWFDKAYKSNIPDHEWYKKEIIENI